VHVCVVFRVEREICMFIYIYIYIYNVDINMYV